MPTRLIALAFPRPRIVPMLPNRRLALMLVVLAGYWGLGASVATAQHKGARRLAPGVVTTVPISPEEGETYSGPVPLKGIVGQNPLLDWKPFYIPKSTTLEEQAKRVILRRDI